MTIIIDVLQIIGILAICFATLGLAGTMAMGAVDWLWDEGEEL